MRAWHCPALSVALLLGGCASGGGERTGAVAPPLTDSSAEPCGEYVAAWVGRFRGNVVRLNGGVESGAERLQAARERLAHERVDEASCERPYCIVHPLGDGRLDSWCGYRRPDPSGKELYLWTPYR